MLSKKWLGSDTLRAMSEKYNALIDLLKGSDEVYQTTFARKLTKILPGNGLQGGGTLEGDRTLSVKPADDGIISGASGIRLDLIQVLTSDSTTQAVSGRVAKTLNERIDAITSGGEVRKIRVAEVYSDMAYEGELPSGQVLIAVGKPLFRPKLFIDGTLIPKSWYIVDLVTGTITLSAPYSDAKELPTFKAKWNVLDEFEVAVKFSYPTLDALVASVDMKSRVNVGDVIQILGEVEDFDGGDRKVKCEATEGLNGINIGTVETPKWLNEVPNSRPELLRALIDANKSDILLRQKKFIRKITSHLDFNTLTEQGTYTIAIDDASTNSQNAPIGSNGQFYKWGTLVVQGEDNFITQTYFPHINADSIILRVQFNGTWQEWNYVFSKLNCSISNEGTGWARFANGLIIQWGLTFPTSWQHFVKFPITFKTVRCILATKTNYHSVGPSNGNVTCAYDLTSITLFPEWDTTVSPNEHISWLAIGF